MNRTSDTVYAQYMRHLKELQTGMSRAESGIGYSYHVLLITSVNAPRVAASESVAKVLKVGQRIHNRRSRQPC